MLKSLIIDKLAQVGIRVHRMPKVKYHINPAVNDIDLEDILRIIKEESDRSPDEPPSWPESRQYLCRRRISSYCDALDLIDEHRIPVADRRVLEIGALFGVLLREVHRRYPTARLCGAECLPKGLAVARRVCPQADIHGESIDTLSFDGLFDLVVLMEVLEHLVDPYEQLQRLDRLVAPGGTLLITIPDGRYDLTKPFEFAPQRQSYRGHVNFWSPESWPVFIRHVLPGRSVLTGPIHSKCLFALIRKE